MVHERILRFSAKNFFFILAILHTSSLTDREVCFAEFARNLAEIMSFWDFCSSFESEQIFDFLARMQRNDILNYFQWWRGEGTCSNSGWRREMKIEEKQEKRDLDQKVEQDPKKNEE